MSPALLRLSSSTIRCRRPATHCDNLRSRVEARREIILCGGAINSPQLLQLSGIGPASVKSLGIDCVPGEWTDRDTELIERKFRLYDLGTPPEFQKFVCGKVLYNYDTLEPSERRIVL